jgi:hypothetical protein
MPRNGLASGDCPAYVAASHAPVAQLDRASDYESEGRTFESFRARHIPPFVAFIGAWTAFAATGEKSAISLSVGATARASGKVPILRVETTSMRLHFDHRRLVVKISEGGHNFGCASSINAATGPYFGRDISKPARGTGLSEPFHVTLMLKTSRLSTLPIDLLQRRPF